MISLWINDKAVEVREGSSVLQAVLSAGVEIAHLCDGRVPESNGWCGLCLVEISGTDDPVLACRTPAEDGMKILPKRRKPLRPFAPGQRNCLPATRRLVPSALKRETATFRKYALPSALKFSPDPPPAKTQAAGLD